MVPLARVKLQDEVGELLGTWQSVSLGIFFRTRLVQGGKSPIHCLEESDQLSGFLEWPERLGTEQRVMRSDVQAAKQRSMGWCAQEHFRKDIALIRETCPPLSGRIAWTARFNGRLKA